MNDNSEKQYDIIATDKYIKLVKNVALAIPPVFFGYLAFSGFNFEPIVNNMTAEWIKRSTFILYYFSWYYGASFDIQCQTEAYKVAPEEFIKKAKITVPIFAILLVCVFLWICWNSTNFKIVSVSFLLFWLINYYGWYKLTKIVEKPIKKSEQEILSSDSTSSLLRLHYVEEYICGKWQNYRFLVGIVVFSIFIAIVFKMQNIMLSSVSFMIVILFVEGWMHLARLKLRLNIKTIDEMKYNPKIILNISEGYKKEIIGQQIV